ncbi:MAG: DNA topoisomerase IV subunit B [Pseudomonadota bacterium]
MNGLFGGDPPSTPSSDGYDASSITVLKGLEPVRKRPGMYIGGTDERALHHLVAEVLDNAMDEAVAGHASRIDLQLAADGSVSVADNGRGIPVDPHPEYPDTSALEVILTTLHAGGKFSDKAYQTSGGLHGVGISVVNALSDRLDVEVARNRRLWGQTYARGLPQGPLEDRGAAPNRRGTTVSFHPDPAIFGASARFRPLRLYRLARSKAYLFRGVEIRWRCDPSLASDEVPAEDSFRFPGGLGDFLAATLQGDPLVGERSFAGRVTFAERYGDGTPGSVEWAVAWTPVRDAFAHSYCNTIPTHEGGTHENGFWAAILKAVRAYGERAGARKAKDITREDLGGGACAMISVFLREPEFVGQTKDRLASADAARLVEGAVRDRADQWLGQDPKSADALLGYLVERAEERARRRAEKETSRKSATRKLRLPGKLTDCSNATRAGSEIFLVEGDSAGGSAKQARNREFQAILPLKGKILNVLGAASAKLGQNQEIADLTQALGIGLGARFRADDLRYDKVIIMTDADVDGAHIAALLMTFFFVHARGVIDGGHLWLANPPLYRLSQGGRVAYAQNDEERARLEAEGLGGKGRIEVSRFKGLGEMNPAQLRETTMHPASRRLSRVTIADLEDTGSLIERLMGKKPEARFAFIQENAQFAEDLDV